MFDVAVDIAVAAAAAAAAVDLYVGDGLQPARLLPCRNILAVAPLAPHSAAVLSLWSTCSWAAGTAIPVARRPSRLRPCWASRGSRSLLDGSVELLAR